MKCNIAYFSFFYFFVLCGITKQVHVHRSIRRWLSQHLEHEHAFDICTLLFLFYLLRNFVFWELSLVVGFWDYKLFIWLLDFCTRLSYVGYFLINGILAANDIWELWDLLVFIWNCFITATGLHLHRSVRPSVLFYTKVGVCCYILYVSTVINMSS